MNDTLEQYRETLVQELGRLSSFAGFSKGMGQIYGLLYLSREPVSLGDIAEQTGMSKGNASLNIKMMERWGLVHPVSKKSDRRDYYQAETNFWKIIRDIMNSRDKKEIDRTIGVIRDIHEKVAASGREAGEEREFYRERLKNMLEFGTTVTQLLQAFLTLEQISLNMLTQTRREEDSPQRGQRIDID